MRDYLLFTVMVVALMGCYKNEDNSPSTEVIIETSEVYANTSISGNVIDDDGQVLSDYSMTINNKLHLITADYFFIELEEARKKGQTIHVYKNDQKVGISTHLLVENDINHMEIPQQSGI